MKSLRSGTVINDDYTGKSIYFLGNSVTLGTGATSTYYRYTTVATRQLSGFGLVEVNGGVSGAVVNTAQESYIPTKTSAMRFLSIAYGINEVPDSSTYSHSNFVTAYKHFLDAAITKGWLASQILIINIEGNAVGQPSYSTSRMVELNGIMDSLHTVYGTLFADIFNPLLTPEYSYVNKGGNVHPDNIGHEVIGYIVAGAIRGAFTFSNQNLMVNGKTQLSDLIYKNVTSLRKSHILGVDSTGNVGVTHFIEPEVHTQGRLWLGGALVQNGVLLPATYDSVKDIIMNYGGKIQSAIAATNRVGSFTPLDVSGNTLISNSFNSGVIGLNVSNSSDGWTFKRADCSKNRDSRFAFRRNFRLQYFFKLSAGKLFF